MCLPPRLSFYHVQLFNGYPHCHIWALTRAVTSVVLRCVVGKKQLAASDRGSSGRALARLALDGNCCSGWVSLTKRHVRGIGDPPLSRECGELWRSRAGTLPHIPGQSADQSAPDLASICHQHFSSQSSCQPTHLSPKPMVRDQHPGTHFHHVTGKNRITNAKHRKGNGKSQP